jgi:hypothetical protein
MKLYRIANWHAIYETHETRKLDRLRWVPMPNKHDGLGFRLMAAEKDACDLYAAWNLIVQVASKSEKGERGILRRGSSPLNVNNLALMTGFPARIFTRAFEFFSQPSVGWLIAEEWQEELALSPGRPGLNPGVAPGRPGSNPAVWNGMEGKEGKEEEPQATVRPSTAVLPFSSDAFRSAWEDFTKHRGEIRKPLKPTSTKMALAELQAMGERRAIIAIKHTIARGWQGIREPEIQEKARYERMIPAPTGPAQLPEPKGWREYLEQTRPGNLINAERRPWSTVDPEIQREVTEKLAKQ